MSSEPDDRVAALEERVVELEAALKTERAPSATRRQVLGSIAAGGVLGGLAGAGSAGAATSNVTGSPASLGTVASNVYKWADPGGLSGPGAARANATDYDTGRVHIASDQAVWSYDTGGGWDILGPRNAALSAGFIVAEAPGYQQVEDPRDYATDADALQSAGDTAQAAVGSDSVVHLHFSPHDPDGNPLTISKTVRFEGNTGAAGTPPVFPKGFGFGGDDNPAAEISIDNGDPAFKLENMRGQGTWWGDFSLTGSKGNNDCEVLRLIEVTGVNARNVAAKELGGPSGNSADGVFVLDSSTNNSIYHAFRYGNTGPDNTGTNVWALRDSRGNGNEPGELMISAFSSFASTSSPFNRVVDMPVGSNVRIGNGSRLEGSGNVAHIVHESGGLVLGTVELGRVEDDARESGYPGSGTDLVYSNGERLLITQGTHVVSNNDTGGDNIHLDGTSEFHIPPTSLKNPNGEAIRVRSKPSSPSTVPWPGDLEGSVTYPASDWQSLGLPGGWRLQAEGTETGVGTTPVSLGSFFGGADSEIYPILSLDSIPSSKVGIDYNILADGGGSNQMEVEVFETEGNTTVDINFVILQRPNMIGGGFLT